MIGYGSQDLVSVSNNITNIYKIIKWRWIISNTIMAIWWRVDLFWTRSISSYRVTERIDMTNKSNRSGPSPPNKHSFLRKLASDQKDYHA